MEFIQGISLTVEQYNALLAAAPLIEAALAKKDIRVVRPDYEGDAGAKGDVEEKSKEQGGEEGGEEDDEDEE